MFQAIIAYLSLLPLTIVAEVLSVWLERRFMPNRVFHWKQRARKMIFEHNLFYIFFFVWHFGSIAYQSWSYQQDFEYSWTGAQKTWKSPLKTQTLEAFLSTYFQTVETEDSCIKASSYYFFSSYGDLSVEACQQGDSLQIKVLPRYFWDTFDNGRSQVLLYEWEKQMKNTNNQ